VEDLRRDLPGLTDFVTLSPVPGFARWLAEQAETIPSAAEVLDLVANQGWHADAAVRDRVGQALLPLAAQYFLEARTAPAVRRLVPKPARPAAPPLPALAQPRRDA
ncbi:MAG: hypothetical protein E5V57_31740, partial [Mesorhizobium sp.]